MHLKRKKKSKNMNLLISCTLISLGLLFIDLYNPSLPSIVSDLKVSEQISKGFVAAYLFGLSISQFFYGPCSDSFGRKPVIIASLALAIFGNTLTSFSVTENQLLFFRFVTGFGAGGCPVISRAILGDIFTDKKELINAFSIFTMVAQISPSFSPILGGFIQDHSSWRINFILLSTLTGIILALLFFLFKETNQNKKTFSLRYVFQGYKEIILNKSFIEYSLMSSLVYSYTVTYYTINPFIFQIEYGLSAFINGSLYIFYSSGLFLGSYLTRKLTRIYDPLQIIRFSILGLYLICSMNFLLSPIYSFYFLIILSTFVSVLCGVVAPILVSLSLEPFSETRGAASALQGGLKMGGVLGVVLISIFFDLRTINGLAQIYLIISFLLSILFIGSKLRVPNKTNRRRF